MQIIATDDLGVCPPVSLSRCLTRLHFAKTAKQIKILFEVNKLVCPRNTVLQEGPDLPQRRKGEVEKNFAHCGPTTYLKIGWS